MNDSNYYRNYDNVILLYPADRFFAKIFGKKLFVHRCKDCNRIPKDVYGSRCLECSKKNFKSE